MSIFTQEDVAAVTSDRLVLVAQTWFPGVTLSPAFVLTKLQAAERDAARRLRCYLEPTEIFPDPPTQEQIDELGGKPYGEEPGYDYDPDFFRDEKWGLLILRQRPVIQVKAMEFAYPTPGQTVFKVPDAWIRVDRKYGHVRLVPAASAFSAPLSAFVMQTLGGGRTIPHMIRVRYTAGLQNAKQEHPDLVDVVTKMAVLKILQDTFMPTSSSISADGLSQSLSGDLKLYMDVVDHQIDILRDEIHGVRLVVV